MICINGYSSFWHCTGQSKVEISQNFVAFSEYMNFNIFFFYPYRADIITLQEVESDQFYNFFLYELAQCGYEGVFSPKSRAKTMNENERKRVDGCAIFFK